MIDVNRSLCRSTFDMSDSPFSAFYHFEFDFTSLILLHFEFTFPSSYFMHIKPALIFSAVKSSIAQCITQPWCNQPIRKSMTAGNPFESGEIFSTGLQYIHVEASSFAFPRLLDILRNTSKDKNYGAPQISQASQTDVKEPWFSEQVDRQKQLESKTSELEKRLRIVTHERDDLAKDELEKRLRIVSLTRERDDVVKDELEKRLRIARERDDLVKELMAAKLRRDTDRFQNLMDPARLEKVVEMFESIYNYERLDALDTLEAAGYDSQTCETIALQTLQEAQRCTRNFLQRHVRDQLCRSRATPADLPAPGDSLPDDVAVPEDFMFSICMVLKEQAFDTDVLPFTELIVQDLSASYPKLEDCKEEENMIDFLKVCARVTWLMAVQSPPMSFTVPETGIPFDKTKHSASSLCKVKDKSRITRIMWPALVGRSERVTLVRAVVIVD